MGVDQATEIVSRLAGLEEAIRELIDRVESLRDAPVASQAPRRFYTVNETANVLSKSAYTVRQWANEGRINAVKRVERRGGSAAWNISADEIERYRNDGLLSCDPRRNDRN